jgi:amino acid permease
MKKAISFCLFLSITIFSYSQEHNIYELTINRDVNKILEEYKTINNNILVLELTYENNNFMNHSDFFEKIISHVTSSIELLPIINKMYWSCIRSMAISTVLYNNGNVQENAFVSGMQQMKDGLIQILQGAEMMGLDINRVVFYIQREYLR